MAGVTMDISERKELEQQLLQARKMEAVGRLAGGIAHDFNNLLTALIGYSEFALERLTPDDPMRADIEEIHKAGLRAAGLTSQLLAFSRRQMLQPKVINLNGVVSGLGNMLRRIIGEDITLETALDEPLGHVKADPGQIEQVILNLAVNARDAMPVGGRLLLETRNAELDEDSARQVGVGPGPYAILRVTDTGAGMDKETQARIFEPFFTTKEQGKGTGLGLATVYGVVAQSGGHIQVLSEPARGTTFEVYLPRVDAGPPAPAAEDRQAPKGAGTLLVVEDEPQVRALASAILRASGYVVLEAASGEQALRVAAEHPGEIDLLVTDMVMPNMTGSQLADRLTSERPGTPVLYMSGYTEGAALEPSALRQGAAFLQKPFAPDALVAKVSGLLSARSRGGDPIVK
jgi:nitrogen-specific signal transduction histidine kinase/ActR/RegA family two-component response regulator